MDPLIKSQQATNENTGPTRHQAPQEQQSKIAGLKIKDFFADLKVALHDIIKSRRQVEELLDASPGDDNYYSLRLAFILAHLKESARLLEELG